MRRTYDIFQGARDKDPLWLEAVEGLDIAVTKMHSRATELPGAYFIYCTHSRAVVANVDTSAARGAKLGKAPLGPHVINDPRIRF
jgi:hypothetical protein